MGDENARAMARRVYDRANDLASLAIKLNRHAADAVAHADNHEPAEAIERWRDLEDEIGRVRPLVDAVLDQVAEAIRETR